VSGSKNSVIKGAAKIAIAAAPQIEAIAKTTADASNRLWSDVVNRFGAAKSMDGAGLMRSGLGMAASVMTVRE
ncbi:MAG: hypothetical protein ACKVH0_18855, partial [Alphaproteobacteria bacterium]